MKRRKYTKIQVLEPEIISMQKAGKPHREIAEHYKDWSGAAFAAPLRLKIKEALIKSPIRIFTPEISGANLRTLI